MQEITFDILWWISAFELPVLAGLFWLFWRNNQETERRLEENRRKFERGHALLREAIAAYKLEVAKNYPSLIYLKDVEKRLTSHLRRIEEKLDGGPRYA
ncbi:MAG: hypothetical protein GY804_03430 [Alphaproteobacteria bacterium]|nr:hypothetical protein [Alphaproteobacteria bacterium]